MINKTISDIEAKIRKSDAVNDPNRAELLNLLSQLKSEIEELSTTHGERAHEIARYAGQSTEQATDASRNPELIKRSLDDLSTSVADFEKSHPKLVQVVNRIATTLSNLGI